MDSSNCDQRGSLTFNQEIPTEEDDSGDSVSTEGTFLDNSVEMAEGLAEQVKSLLAKVETLEAGQSTAEDHTPRLTPKIELFSGSSSEDASLWLSRFEQVANFYNWSNSKRVSALMLYLRGPAETWAKTLDCTEYNTFKDMFLAKFVHKAARFLLDSRFHERKMKKGETVEHFLTDLQQMARQLEKPETETLGQFLRGLPSSIKPLVMTQSPDTLNDAAQMAMVAESVQKETDAEEKSSLQSTVTSLTTGLQQLSSKIDNMQRRPQPMGHPRPMPGGRYTAALGQAPQSRNSTSRNGQHTDASMQCWSCGETGHRQRNCPKRQASSQYRANFQRIRCFNCNNEGHMKRNCPLANHPF